MTEENLHSLESLYQQYKNLVKPLLAEIEAVYEKFPLALYNEIRAMNDHVARAFTADADAKATEQIGKALSHINRITRDCYKFLNVHYKRESEKFDRHISSVEPRTVKECGTMAEYGKLSDEAASLVEYAKQKEYTATDEQTYQNFEKAYNAYRRLHAFIVGNRRDILSMRVKKGFKVAASVVFSIFTFILGCIITNNNQSIVNAFKNWFTRH